MITKFGKRFITSYLAGMVSFPKQDIAIGISSTAPDSSGNDTRLGFEFYRLPSAFGSIDIQTDELGATTYGLSIKQHCHRMLRELLKRLVCILRLELLSIITIVNFYQILKTIYYGRMQTETSHY